MLLPIVVAEARTLLPTRYSSSKIVNEARTPLTYGSVLQTPQVRIEEYTDLD